MRNQLNLHKTVLFYLVLASILMAACAGRRSDITYEFTTISRGSLERSISASGTINPVSTVRVLPQMSGKVEKIYVSNNDFVQRGDVLAELNTDMLRLRRDQQQASVTKARANYELQLLNYQNQLILAERNFISEFELRSSRTTLNNLAADLEVAEANLRVIETEINQFAYITSPIDGIVLERRINIGDTVVDSSSNNSSNMFTLAENLLQMQIEAMVGELDIVSIRRGQMVRFTLESMPGRTFQGQVETINMIPVVTNNVVSYTVIINVENLDGSLFPGMTCAVDFIVENSRNILMVSNAALRYQPTNLSEETIADMVFNASLENLSNEQQQLAIEAREVRTQNTNQNTNTSLANLMMGMGGGRQFGMMPGSRPGAGQGGNSSPAVVMRNLWFINGNGILEVMEVQIGISSGSFTEIHVADDMEGKQVIMRERI